MNRSSKARALLALTVVGISQAQGGANHTPDPQVITTVAPESYGVYSALITQHYRELLRRNIPVKIAAYTTSPDRNHGDLLARCSSGARNEGDRELIGRLLAGDTLVQKLEARLTLPGRYSIIEGKEVIRDGVEPGIVWLSVVSFSKDRKHAMVWMRNFCGGLCGSGLIWKLDLTTKGWRVIDNVPNCGFIS